ncbi:hypothetical protein BFJ63_vAg18573 [Fusarium oxysporum f. sp. narcissi]|uniref:Enoyl reductase (ER) domain-containing protein n=1 Tax=Fusarium oxysporum f. sp. narcissi TaxID=451672 RepID=A0A4Q2UX46_FUSOX|nr:hypothetical protein BFJ63_vAg18573 [Fusarium oxysporum f. sp. narcissi]
MVIAVIPRTQRAAILTGAYGQPHTIRTNFPVTAPGAGQLLVKLEASGVCKGDVNPRDGYPPAPPLPNRPLVTGHEGVGIVVAVGDAVLGFNVGDRVGMGWRSEVCTSCDRCERGDDNLCQKLKMNGYETNGTFQGACHDPSIGAVERSHNKPVNYLLEYITISSSSLIPIPFNTIPATHIAPLLCAGGTALAGLRATGLATPGKWVCLTGAAGGVGGLASRYALHEGLKVVAVDSAQKADICKALGVHAFVDYENADTVVSRIKEATGGSGPHGVVVCSANPQSYSQAVEYAAVGAHIVSIGPSMVHLHTGPIMVKGLVLIPQSNANSKIISEAIRLGVEDHILPEVELVDLDNIDEVLDRVRDSKTLKKCVIKWWKQLQVTYLVTK